MRLRKDKSPRAERCLYSGNRLKGIESTCQKSGIVFTIRGMIRGVCLSALVFVFQSTGLAAVTFNFDANRLDDASGNPMLLNSLVVVVASPTDSIFGGPSGESFVTGDDVVLGKFTLDSGLGAGYFQRSVPINLNDFAGLSTGDPLQLYWYPTLTVAATQPGFNTAYGQFRSDTPETVNHFPWAVQPDGGAYEIAFFTTEGGGSHPASAGDASLVTPVPEPSHYAAAFAACCLAWAVINRNRPQKSA
jgi:hypothetical protein